MGAATLEVGLNNPILEAGFEIICSPTSSPGSLEAVRKTLQVCQVELHPFFVYGYDGKGPMNQQVRKRGGEGEREREWVSVSCIGINLTQPDSYTSGGGGRESDKVPYIELSQCLVRGATNQIASLVCGGVSDCEREINTRAR